MYRIKIDSETGIMERFSDGFENGSNKEIEQHISKGITLFGASIDGGGGGVIIYKKPIISEDIGDYLAEMGGDLCLGKGRGTFDNAARVCKTFSGQVKPAHQIDN